MEKINKLYHCFDKISIDSHADVINPPAPPSIPLLPLDPKSLTQCDTIQICPDLDPVIPLQFINVILLSIILLLALPNIGFSRVVRDDAGKNVIRMQTVLL